MWAGQLVGPGILREVSVPGPRAADLAPAEAIVRVLAGGVCGSDHTPFLQGAKRPDEPSLSWPRPAGYPMHEIVGEVVHTASDLLAPGDRIVGWVKRSAGLAELAVVDDAEVIACSDLRPTDAVLLQPLACVIHALNRVDVVGRTVAILGMGPAGALFGHVARSRGAHQVVGVDPVDRSWLKRSGCADVFLPVDSGRWSAQVAVEQRPQLIVEAVGHQVDTLSDAVSASATGGTILAFGIPDQDVYPIDMEQMIRRDLTLVAGVTRDRRAALAAAEAYLRRHPGLAGDLITHRFGRDRIQDGYRTAMEPSPDRLKVVFDLAGGSG